MGEIDNDDDSGAHHLDDKFYFVNEDRLKESLSGGVEGPSFSVASLFSSKPLTSQDDSPADQPEPPKTSGPARLFAKQTLFITDPKDPRVVGVGQFFNVPTQIDPQEMKAMRREIALIVKSKFKRAERNRENAKKPSLNKFSRQRHNFIKKRKT